MTWGSPTLTGEGAPARLVGQKVTASYLDVLGMLPVVGRLFTAAEERDSLVLISYRMWVQRYAGDRAAIGKAITLDGKPFRICGVMPSHFRVLGDPDVWTTLALDADPARRNSHILRVIARRKVSVTPEQASADMDVIGARISALALFLARWDSCCCSPA